MLPQDIRYADRTSPSFVGDRLSARPLGPGRLVRLAARFRSRSLDEALIAGADPSGSAQLAARAAQLTSRRTRLQIAEGLERLVWAADQPQRRWWAVSPESPALATATELGDLAALLRERTPLYARGIAILYQLVTDGSGPAYRGTAASLGRELDEARAAVGGCAERDGLM
ncbi:MAG: hypothetical protein ACLQBY_14745 [Solirubrobacteraceae bacterium]